MQLNIEQNLKERLVGMGVLIFLGIIVIPWILDGERPDELNADNSAAQTLHLPSPDGLKTRDINLQDGSIKIVNVKTPARTKQVKASAEASSAAPSNANPATEESNSLSIDKNNSAAKQMLEKASSAETKTTKAGVGLASEINLSDSNSNNRDEEKVKAQVKAQDTTVTTKEAKSTSELKVSKEIESQSSGDVLSLDRVTPTPIRTMQEQVKADPIATWTVQMGSFGDKTNADRLVKKLNEKGFPAFVNRYQNDSSKVLFRVRVGTEKDRGRADKLHARLVKSGFDGKVLTHP